MFRQSPLSAYSEMYGELICSKIGKFPKRGGYDPVHISSFFN